jgi:hypothetical protein
MRGAIPPLPQYVFIAWCSVKHRNNFTFTSNITRRIDSEFGNFSHRHRIQTGSGDHPASSVVGTAAFSPGGEANHSPSPYGSTVKDGLLDLHIETFGRTPWTGDQPDARPLPT